VESPSLVALARSRFVFNLNGSLAVRRSVGSRRTRSYNTPMPTEPSKDPLLTRVGKRIQDLRESKRIEPKDFAKAAGFSLSYLWRLEGGQQNITLATISRLAIALGEPMSALLDGIDPDPSTLVARPYVRKPKRAASGGAGDKAGGV
jgi:DNA-binding Xre family transcriptional regulator